MNETEEDRQYYQAAEAAFIRRRGTPFLLSPRDFAQLKEWRALGVPLEAIEQGIDDAFSRREARAATGRVNSLAYCRDAVLEAWERRAATAVGRGSAGKAKEPDVAAALAGLEKALSEVSRARPDLAAPMDSALRSLERLGKSGKTAEETEALPEEERKRLDAGVERALARAGLRMDAETARRTASALTRRTLRETLDLPRLTLL
jgi:hypothetical protein